MNVRADRAVASFDSASAMLRALARFLRGQDFPGLGITSPALEPLAELVNRLPTGLRETLYTWSGWNEALPPELIGEVRAEAIARWAVDHYPRRRYPAAMIGSSNGAAVHLGAALGIPWLPQTMLIPVRQPGIPPDEPKRDLEWARGPARALLDANPELQLHHMHDANQDRLMIQRMTYFRVKRLRLGEAYTRFLEDTVEPGGTLFVLECELAWPTTQVGERHIFQHGALGGATVDEFIHGSARVANYLGRYGSPRLRWDSPVPDGNRPEAEWGFEPTLRADIEALARRRGYHVRRILFTEPEDLSPFVADLYRWWYRELGLPADRLLVESFILLEPWWALRTGSAPFWMVFNMEPSADALERYLDTAERHGEPFDEIGLMLFAHGVESVGLPSIERWRDLLGRARRRGRFLGVDERAFPRDFAVFVRYYTELKRRIVARYPMPRSLMLDDLDRFVAEAGHRYKVQWREDAPRR